jgi:7 transmembrane receptor (Secretin family)
VSDDAQRNWACKCLTSVWHFTVVANYSWILMEGLYLHNLIFMALFSDSSAITLHVVLGWGESLNALSIYYMLFNPIRFAPSLLYFRVTAVLSKALLPVKNRRSHSDGCLCSVFAQIISKSSLLASSHQCELLFCLCWWGGYFSASKQNIHALTLLIGYNVSFIYILRGGNK